MILEVNTRPPIQIGMRHLLPHHSALAHAHPMTEPTSALASPPQVDSKVVAVVHTHGGDRNNQFSAPDEASNRIASYIIDFLVHEMHAGRLPKQMLPIQSGVGNVANAVLAGLLHGPFEQLLGFTEVLQDGMLDLLRAGKRAAPQPRRSRCRPRRLRISRRTSTSTAAASSCARRKSPTTPSWCAAWA